MTMRETEAEGAPEERRPFWGKCRGCGHCWPIGYMPMVVETMARLAIAAACPMCGDDKPVVARQDNGVLLEPGAAADDRQEARSGDAAAGKLE